MSEPTEGRAHMQLDYTVTSTEDFNATVDAVVVAAAAGGVASAPTVVGPAAATGVVGVAAGVAFVAGVVSIGTGLGYSMVTRERVERGDIAPNDIRADLTLGRISNGSGALGLGPGVGGHMFGVVGLGCAMGVAGVELSRF